MRMCRSLSASGALLVMASSIGIAQARRGNATPVLPTREVVDGVVRLTHRADAFVRAPHWSLASEPLFTAGGADSPVYDITNAREVELLSVGRMVRVARVCE